ncbi:MAG: S8 family serine peptidase, partial [Clostridia bacterium]
ADRIGENLYYVDTIEEAEMLSDKAEIISAEPNYKLSLLDSAVNDPYYEAGYQWNLDNIKVTEAWALSQYGSGATVAVIDSGLYGMGDGDRKHEDIDYDKVVKAENFATEENGVPDSSGHGTLVSGMIFAKTNNNLGIAGMMPEAELMPLKIFGPDGATVAAAVEAINYAVENGADVINMSFGTSEYSDSLASACKDAVDRNVILVAAAGNDGTSENCYPAAYNCVIGVGALNEDNSRYKNSQYGESVYVAAPGAGVIGTGTETNTYVRDSGTSLAAPAVSALAAMAKSIDGEMTPEEFKQLLADTSTDLGESGFDIYYGWGIIDFGSAAKALTEEEPADGHHYSAWTSDGESTHSRICQDEGCGHKETAFHSWDHGQVTKIPTADTEGEKTYTCTICKETKTEKLSATDQLSNGTYEYELIQNGTEIKITKYIGSQTQVVVPSEISIAEGDALPVTVIGNQTFQGTNIILLEIPSSVTKVEDGGYTTSGVVGACADCKSLTQVKIPSSLNKIADYMFYNSGSNYRMILDISTGVKEIGDYAFSLCHSIVELDLPESVTIIGEGAFYQSRRLTTLIMPGVYIVRPDAFTETIFEEKYDDQWSEGAFSGTVYAGENAYLYMGENGTKNMPEDEHIVLNDGTLGISDFYLDNHFINKSSVKKNLRTLSIPATVRYIPDGIFNGYEDLTLYVIKDSYAHQYAVANGLHFICLDETVGDQTEEYDWYDDHVSDRNFVISTAEELRAFSDIVLIGEDDFSGDTVTIAADIDLGGIASNGFGIPKNAWYPLNGFAGTLDGGGHEISGIYIHNPTRDRQGFFSSFDAPVTVKNLHLKGSVCGYEYVGGIVGEISKTGAKSIIENCSFNGSVTARGQIDGYAGGIAGYSWNSTIADCETFGTVFSYATGGDTEESLQGYTGGITAYAGGGSVLRCVNHSKVTGKSSAAGGVVGQALMSTVSGCENEGTVYGNINTGGVVGKLTSNGKADQCRNSGDVVASGRCSGGVVGTAVGAMGYVKDCENSGSVSGTESVGGILGYSEGSKVQNGVNSGSVTGNISVGGVLGYGAGWGVFDSVNHGEVVCKKHYGAGVFGYAIDGVTVSGCYNDGNVSGGDYLGGILGYSYMGNTIEYCYNLGSISGTKKTAGLIGNQTKTGTITHCYNVGEISAENGEAA